MHGLSCSTRRRLVVVATPRVTCHLRARKPYTDRAWWSPQASCARTLEVESHGEAPSSVTRTSVCGDAAPRAASTAAKPLDTCRIHRQRRPPAANSAERPPFQTSPRHVCTHRHAGSCREAIYGCMRRRGDHSRGSALADMPTDNTHEVSSDQCILLLDDDVNAEAGGPRAGWPAVNGAPSPQKTSRRRVRFGVPRLCRSHNL